MRGRHMKNGFTLIELLVVVVVIAILAALAYPSYQNSVRKSRRADAQGALLGLSNAMERRFTTNSTYAGAATGGANTGAPTIFSTEAPVDGSPKYYDLTISAATAASFTVRATPKGAQSGDGFIELDHTGARRWDKNNNGVASDAGENNWAK